MLDLSRRIKKPKLKVNPQATAIAYDILFDHPGATNITVTKDYWGLGKIEGATEYEVKFLNSNRVCTLYYWVSNTDAEVLSKSEYSSGG